MSFNPGASAFNTALPLGYRRSFEGGELRVVLVAAEPEVRLELRRLLDGGDGIDVVGEAAGCATAIEHVVTLMPDVVFLAMDGGGPAGTTPTTIEATIEAIRAVPEAPEIVLFSASHEDAVHAFEAGALDFLLRPFSADRLRQTIARARRSLGLAREAGIRGVPAYYQAGSALPSPAVSRLGVHKGKRVLLLSLKDVSYVRIEDKLIFVHSGPDRYLINRTIAELAELLGNDGFFQINRGTLINLNYLVEIVPWFSGTYRLKMSDGAELPLSRDRVAQLKTRIGLPKKWSGK